MNFVLCVHYEIMKNAENIKILNIFYKYSLESIFTDDSIIVKFDDYPLIYFYLNINFDNIEAEEKFITNCDDYNVDNVLELILENETIVNSIIINSINIKTETHQRLFYVFYDVLRIYYSIYKEIPTINISSDDSGFCPYYSLYYTIELSPDLRAESFIERLMESEKNKSMSSPTVKEISVEESFINKYYELIEWHGWQDFSKNINIIYTNEIRNITLQTKVRRLAYLKMILNMFKKSAYYPANVFTRKIEIEAEEHNNQLLYYHNSKGIIERSKTGNSSKPYVEALLSLQLLYTQNNMYKASKYGKIYNIIDSKLSNINDNFFELETYQKSFFLFFIFKNDELYIWILFNIIYIENNITTYKKIKEVFQGYLLSELEEVIKSSVLSVKDKDKIITKIKRIKEWKNPERYLEHIIEPRINWLLDLDLLDRSAFKNNDISLSQNGLKLFDILNSYYDVFLEKYLISEQLLCSDFFDMVNELYKVNAIPNTENNFDLIDNYINESFSLFKTLAPNRVTASQAILYTCNMMLFKEKTIVNFCTIKNYLSSKENKSFIFDWYKTENDGSIRRKK